jgi:putative spermidine/putrescine transport system ATP-binding protein
VLLLHEPFGALDAKVRVELRVWLRELQRRLGLTTIFVTHDQHEAFQLADRVAILNAGRIAQVGSGADIRARPATPFVTAFLGAAPVSEVGIGDGPTVAGGTAAPCKQYSARPYRGGSRVNPAARVRCGEGVSSIVPAFFGPRRWNRLGQRGYSVA